MTREDKLSKEIVTRVENIAKKSGKYFTGTAKMFLASTGEVMSSKMPTVGTMLEMNKDLTHDLVQFLRNPNDGMSRGVAKAIGSETVQSLQRLGKNMLDDLKTGNLYDPTRDRSIFGERTQELLNSFGGVDMSGFNDDGSYTEPVLTADQKVQLRLAEGQNRRDDARTIAVLDSVNLSTKATINSANLNAQQQMRLSMRQHSQMMGGISNMITQQAATLTAVNQLSASLLEVTRETHKQVIERLDQTNNLLTQIAVNTTSPSVAANMTRDDMDFMGPSGAIDLRKYAKAVMRKADDKYGLSSTSKLMTGGMGAKGMIDMLQSNPWMAVTNVMVDKLMPEYLKTAMETTQSYLENFIPAMLTKFADKGKRFDSAAPGDKKLSDFVMGLLGVTPSAGKPGVDNVLRDPNAQAVLTNRTVHAVEQVIPMWLSKIYSAVSGDDLAMYNYRTGRMEKAKYAIAREAHRANDYVGNMGSAAYNINQRARTVKFKDPELDQKFQDYVYQALNQAAADGRTLINPYKSKKQLREELPYGDDVFQDAYIALLRSLPRSELMKLSREVHSARQTRNATRSGTYSDLQESGLGILFSGMAGEEMTKKLSKSSQKKAYGLDDYDVDKIATKTQLQAYNRGLGMKPTNVAINDILSVLNRGIITYSYIIGDSKKLGGNIPGYQEALAGQKEFDTYTTRLAKQQQRRDMAEAEFKRERQAERNRLANEKNRRDRDMIINPYGPNRTSFERLLAQQRDVAVDMSGYYELDNPEARAYLEKMQAQENKKFIYNKLGIKQSKGKDITPFRLVQQGLEAVDNAMFTVIFGEEVPEGYGDNDNQVHSFMKTMEMRIRGEWEMAKDWFGKNIGEPLKNFFFGENSIIGRTVNRAKEKVNDKLSSIGSAIKDKVMDRYGDQINAVKEKGQTTGAAVANSMMDALDKFLYGSDKENHGRSVDKKGNVSYSGFIGKLRRAGDNFTQFMFGPDADGNDHGSREKWNIVKSEINKAAPDMIIGSGIGLLSSMFLPGGPVLGMILGAGTGFVKNSESFQHFLFGDKMTREVVVIGSDGNPVMVRDPKTHKLVPKTKKIESRKGALISGPLYDGIKQYLPKTAGSAAAGWIIGGGLIPGLTGHLLGGFAGSIAGMVASSDRLKRMLFGDEEDETGNSGLFSKNMREKLVKSIVEHGGGMLVGKGVGKAVGGLAGKAIGTALMTASGGIIPAAVGSLVGPVLGALGGAAGFFAGPKLVNMIFGEEQDVEVVDPKTGKKVRKKQRMGGMFGKVYDATRDELISPFAEKMNAAGRKIQDWFHESIIDPLQRSMDPAKKAMHDAGEAINRSIARIGDRFSEMLNNAIGMPLKDFTKEKIIDPMSQMTSKIFGVVGKIIGGIVSAPFKAMEYIFTGSVQGTSERERKKRHKAQDREERRQLRAFNREEKREERAARKAKKRNSDIVGSLNDVFGEDENDEIYEEAGRKRRETAEEEVKKANRRSRRKNDKAKEASKKTKPILKADEEDVKASSRRAQESRERAKRARDEANSENGVGKASPRASGAGARLKSDWKTVGRIYDTLLDIRKDLAHIRGSVDRHGSPSASDRYRPRRKGLIGSILGAAGSIASLPFKVVGGVARGAGKVVGGVASAAGSVLKGGVDLVGGILGAGVRVLAAAGNILINAVSGVASVIGSIMGGLVHLAAGAVGVVGNILGGGIKILANAGVGIAKGAFNIVSAVPRAAASIIGAGAKTAGSLLGGTLKLAGSIISAPFKLVNSLLGGGHKHKPPKGYKGERRKGTGSGSSQSRTRVTNNYQNVTDLSKYGVGTSQGPALRVWVVGQSETSADIQEDHEHKVEKKQEMKERKEDRKLQRDQLRAMERMDKRQHRAQIMGLFASLFGGIGGDIVKEKLGGIIDNFMAGADPDYLGKKNDRELKKRVVVLGMPNKPKPIMTVKVNGYEAIPVFIAGSFTPAMPDLNPEQSFDTDTPNRGSTSYQLGRMYRSTGVMGAATFAGRKIGRAAGEFGETVKGRFDEMSTRLSDSVNPLSLSNIPGFARGTHGRRPRRGPAVVGEPDPMTGAPRPEYVRKRGSDKGRVVGADGVGELVDITPETEVLPVKDGRVHKFKSRVADASAAAIMNFNIQAERAKEFGYNVAGSVSNGAKDVWNNPLKTAHAVKDTAVKYGSDAYKKVSSGTESVKSGVAKGVHTAIDYADQGFVTAENTVNEAFNSLGRSYYHLAHMIEQGVSIIEAAGRQYYEDGANRVKEAYEKSIISAENYFQQIQQSDAVRLEHLKQRVQDEEATMPELFEYAGRTARSKAAGLGARAMDYLDERRQYHNMSWREKLDYDMDEGNYRRVMSRLINAPAYLLTQAGKDKNQKWLTKAERRDLDAEQLWQYNMNRKGWVRGTLKTAMQMPGKLINDWGRDKTQERMTRRDRQYLNAGQLAGYNRRRYGYIGGAVRTALSMPGHLLWNHGKQEKDAARKSRKELRNMTDEERAAYNIGHYGTVHGGLKNAKRKVGGAIKNWWDKTGTWFENEKANQNGPNEGYNDTGSMAAEEEARLRAKYTDADGNFDEAGYQEELEKRGTPVAIRGVRKLLDGTDWLAGKASKLASKIRDDNGNATDRWKRRVIDPTIDGKKIVEDKVEEIDSALANTAMKSFLTGGTVYKAVVAKDAVVDAAGKAVTKSKDIAGNIMEATATPRTAVAGAVGKASKKASAAIDKFTGKFKKSQSTEGPDNDTKAGESESRNHSANFLRIFKKRYKDIDSQTEKARSPKDLLDKAIAGAQSPEDIEAIKTAHQLNSDTEMPTIGEGEDGKKTTLFDLIKNAFGKDGIIGKLTGFFTGGGLLTTLTGWFGKTGIGSAISSILSKFGLGDTVKDAANVAESAAETAGAAANAGGMTGLTAMSSKLINSPLYAVGGAIGTVKAAKEGYVGHAAAYGGRTAASLVQIFSKALAKLLSSPTVTKVIAKLGTKFPNFAGNLTKMFSSAAGKLGGAALSKFLAKANLAIMVATAVADFTTGMVKASEHFNVGPNDVNIRMRFAAGIAKAVSGLAFGLLPVDPIAQFIYKLVANKEEEEDLAQKQQVYASAVEQFNKENGTNLSIEEFQKSYKIDKDGNVVEKTNILGSIKNGLAKTGETIGKIARGTLSAITSVVKVYAQLTNTGIVQGDPVGMWKHEVTVDEDNPVGSLVKAVATGAKVALTPMSVGSWVGHKIGEAVGKVIDNTKADISNLSASVDNIKTASSSGDLKGVWADKLTIQGPFGKFFHLIHGTAKIFFTLPTLISKIHDMLPDIGNKLNEVWDDVKSFGGDVKDSVVNTATNGWNKVKSGWNSAKSWVSDKLGRGPIKGMRQTTPDNCGPTAAAMIASAYGNKVTPDQMDQLSYTMGMRAGDGGTNPAFFTHMANQFGRGAFSMQQGPVSSSALSAAAAEGRPVTVMGKGGPYGGGEHYMVLEGVNGRGKTAILRDPYDGSRKTVPMNNLVNNTDTAIYSRAGGRGRWGRGDEDEVKDWTYVNANGDVRGNTSKAGVIAAGQKAVVDKMRWLQQNPITYSQSGPQDPDQGSASCASTVGWAYRKAFGVTGMSASSQEQAKDTRFATILDLGSPGTTPNKTFDVGQLQPGDIVYMYNPPSVTGGSGSNHTEMYVGNGVDLSHGGGVGPQERALDATRQKRVWRIRRYLPFMDGSAIKIDTSDPINTWGTPNNASSTEDGSDGPVSILDFLQELFSAFGKAIFGNGSKDLSSVGTNGVSSVGQDFNFGGSAGTTTPTENKKNIWNFLRKEGYTEEGAAGLMGCWENESANRPDRLEGDYLSKWKTKFGTVDNVLASNANLNDYTLNYLFPAYKSGSIDKSAYRQNDGNYYPGVGLAQWTGPRAYRLMQFAIANGEDWRSLDTQLKFFKQEQENSYPNLKNELNAATTPEEGARAALDGFEMYPGWSNKTKGQEQLAVRAKSAAQIYNTYKGSMIGTNFDFNSRWQSMNDHYGKQMAQSNAQKAQDRGMAMTERYKSLGYGRGRWGRGTAEDAIRLSQERGQKLTEKHANDKTGGNPLNKAYTVTSPFGNRNLTGVVEGHKGIDLVPADGSGQAEVGSRWNGTVTYVKKDVPNSHTGLNVSNNTGGNMVFITTDDGMVAKHMHLEHGSIPDAIQVGARVTVGQKLGNMGTTGRSTGKHLHYQLDKPNGNPIDPLPSVQGGNTLSTFSNGQVSGNTPTGNYSLTGTGESSGGSILDMISNLFSQVTSGIGRIFSASAAQTPAPSEDVTGDTQFNQDVEIPVVQTPEQTSSYGTGRRKTVYGAGGPKLDTKYNVKSINYQIAALNSAISKAYEETNSSANVETLTRAITDAVHSGAGENGGNSEALLQTISTTLATMLEVMMKMSDKMDTSGKRTAETSTTEINRDYAYRRALAPTFPNGKTNVPDIGATIMRELTRSH